uniref:Uncharacterized protein n=1 Tax=Arundo donax TaxID=35708 RepID=A0A0A9BB21_ARUDO
MRFAKPDLGNQKRNTIINFSMYNFSCYSVLDSLKSSDVISMNPFPIILCTTELSISR